MLRAGLAPGLPLFTRRMNEMFQLQPSLAGVQEKPSQAPKQIVCSAQNQAWGSGRGRCRRTGRIQIDAVNIFAEQKEP